MLKITIHEIADDGVWDVVINQDDQVFSYQFLSEVEAANFRTQAASLLLPAYQASLKASR